MKQTKTIREQFEATGIPLSKESYRLWIQNTLGRRVDLPLNERVLKGNVMKCLGPAQGPSLQVRLHGFAQVVNTEHSDFSETLKKLLYQLAVSINPISDFAITIIRNNRDLLLKTNIPYSDVLSQLKDLANRPFIAMIVDLVDQIIAGNIEDLPPVLSGKNLGDSEMEQVFRNIYIDNPISTQHEILEGEFLHSLAVKLGTLNEPEELEALFYQLEQLYLKFNFLPVFIDAADMLAYDMYEVEKENM